MSGADPLAIRPLAATDSLDALTALLHRAYAPLGAAGLNFTAVDQTPAVTAARIDGGCCFVAQRDGRIVGTAVVKPTHARSDCSHFMRPGVATVHQLAVDPALQRAGIGRSLLTACEAWARASGHAELAIDTAEPAHHLVALYERLGYRRLGHVQWPGKTYRSVVLSKALR